MQNSSTTSLAATWKKVDDAAAFVAGVIHARPLVGVVLGSGLGDFARNLEILTEVPYSSIPHFPVSTVVGHAGKLILARVSGVDVLVMQGRFHFYEGYSMEDLVLPVRVMHTLGARHLLLSNAAGGVNPAFDVGDLMMINDHINLFPTNPLMGPNDDARGPRFPDMSQAYSSKLRETARNAADQLGIEIREGVYAGLTGPCLETPAEYGYIRAIGADAVGMSTVPETIAARHLGMEVFGMSVITDLGVPGKIGVTTHAEVVRVAASREPDLTALFISLIASLA